MIPKTDSPPPLVLTKKQAGDLLQITERSVHTLIRRGLLPAVRFGGTVRIDPADLRAFIVKQKGVAHA